MSKGGTTEAAFKVFADADLAGALSSGIQAASRRATQLSDS
ncbi:MAG: hypothetical protein JNM62_04570 [Flavobacteriales bacterium]|nr:hypothetical protein [Flavobacteriales bacterium]